jgi:hypothetical protein
MTHCPPVLRVLSQTYVFWATLSITNFGLLYGLAIPPLALFYARFVPFVAPPLGVALSIATVTTYALIKLAPTLNCSYATLAFNLLVLLLFLPAADAYKEYLINQALTGRAPDCVHYGSFREAVFEGDRNFRGNGGYEEGGYVYLWSYSQRHFFVAPHNNSGDFSCQNKRVKSLPYATSISQFFSWALQPFFHFLYKSMKR